MSQPRSAEQVHAEQVQQVRDAIAAGAAYAAAQQAAAGSWLDASVPEVANVIPVPKQY